MARLYYRPSTYLFMLAKTYLQSPLNGALLTLYYAGRLAGLRVLAGRVVRFRCGHGLEFRDFLDKYWVYSMPGHYEERTIRVLMEYSGEGEVFYDVGVNVGFHGVHVGVGGARVVAFEPDPRVWGLLRANLESHGVAHTIIPRPACDEERDVILHLMPKPEHSSLASSGGSMGGYRVKCVSIDGLVDSGVVAPPTMVKIDVEGAEVMVLRGMERTLDSARPSIVVIEVGRQTIGGVVGFMKGKGYRYQGALDGWGGRWNVLFTAGR